MKKDTTKISDQITEIFNNLEGAIDVIPTIWYKRILKQTSRNRSPYLLAILLLSDIIYWYRNVAIRDEATGNIKAIKKRFSADKLQRNYFEIKDRYGVSKDVARDAINFLRRWSLITVEFRDLKTKNGKILRNRMFPQPVPNQIKKLCCLNSEYVPKIIDISRECNRGSGEFTTTGGGEFTTTGGGEFTTQTKNSLSKNSLSKNINDDDIKKIDNKKAVLQKGKLIYISDEKMKKEKKISKKEKQDLQLWREQLLSSISFVDSCKVRYKHDGFEEGKMSEYINQFLATKEAQEKTNWESFKDFKDNFFFWLKFHFQNGKYKHSRAASFAKTKSNTTKAERMRKVQYNETPYLAAKSQGRND